MIDREAGPETMAVRAEQRDRIRQALDALPEHHRAIIMLGDLEGLSYREIAEVLQIPMGTVMSRLHNARKRLREVLRPLLVLLVALALVMAPVAALAQPVVKFSAQVLVASDTKVQGAANLPAEIERLVPRLRRTLRYPEYSLLSRYSGSAPVGAAQSWSVPGDRRLEITPENAAPVRLRVRLLRGGVAEVSTLIQAAPGAPAVIGGPRYDSGVLIIVVSPQP